MRATGEYDDWRCSRSGRSTRSTSERRGASASEALGEGGGGRRGLSLLQLRLELPDLLAERRDVDHRPSLHVSQRGKLHLHLDRQVIGPVRAAQKLADMPHQVGLLLRLPLDDGERPLQASSRSRTATEE